MSKRKWSIMVTGGAGYVGSQLVPRLLADGHKVTVLDLYLYGDVFKDLPDLGNLTEIKGDIRNIADIKRSKKSIRIDPRPSCFQQKTNNESKAC